MAMSMKGMKRSHYCGEISASTIGETVTIMGWVNKRRYLSGLIFIVVRDRTGIVQVAVNQESVTEEQYLLAKDTIRGEYVVAVTGMVIARTPENVNPDMATGEIEIEVTELRVLSESEVPPFQVADEGVAIDMRLKHRYIDLRRPEVQKVMQMRHKTAQVMRQFLSETGHIEVETPILINSSPEGARDYLVPSRTHPGQFYALPQSPQQMKQILMISGFDKYFQLAKCFRDEDLRADRQPEFTQLDIEQSFVEDIDIQTMAEALMVRVFKEIMDINITAPFPRITWFEAMERYGSDKPDTRFGMELANISDLEVVKNSDFQVFSSALESGGCVRGFNAEGCAAMPRKQIDAMVEVARTHKAKGLAWIVHSENGEIKSTLSKFFTPEELAQISAKFNAKPGDLIFLCADETQIVLEALGAVRLAVAKWKNIIPENVYNFLWVVEFPLLEWSPDDNRFYAAHHPFTSPLEEDIPLLKSEPAKVRAKAYDLVLNGYEIAGGSIRIHQREVQDLMFTALGFTPESATEGFGYFLEALKYGVPPHGGIAFGFDRFIMILAGLDSIREVIAFPKVKDASCPMTQSPSIVSNEQLNELGIQRISE